MGAPIRCDKVADPSDAQVDAIHKVYVAALEKLYDDHKDKYGAGCERIKFF